MLKLTGLILLVAASSIAGVIKAEELRKRVVILEDYKKMVMELKSRINYFRQPFVYIKSEDSLNGDISAFSLLDRLRSDIEEKEWEISRIWSDNIEAMYMHTPLQKEDIEIMKYLGNFIGQSDYENQIYHFEYLENRLDKQIASAADIYKLRGPLCRKLGFLSGILIAFMLI